jgi:hypothetical protein
VPQIRNVTSCYQRCILQGNSGPECDYICNGGTPPPSPVIGPVVPGCQPKPVSPCQPRCRTRLFSNLGCGCR